ncbi:unnamed protein product [Cuscuta campestris]|uniref:Reverse transcriptase domain-containing protein n=1 Tax=Cuscuta campestris TaxID=132261 RepID=A0A484L100_9ASTE|nr:unnamed protein product [Cuscuta campestris]
MECRFSGRDTESEVEVKIDSHLVPKVDMFRYLGSVIQADGELDADVGHRVGVAWAKWRLASGVLCDPKISPRMKGKFYRSVVRPAMLYGAECWAVKKTHVEPGVSWKQPPYFRVGASSGLQDDGRGGVGSMGG